MAAPNTQDKLDMVPTLANMGLEVIEDSPSRVYVRMPLEGNSNHFKAAYAGALFSLAEFPFGFLFFNRVGTEPMYPLVGEMTIRYMAPAMSDVYVDARLSDDEWQEIYDTTKAKGKMKIERVTELKDKDGNLLAVVNATYFSVLAG
ncbi:MAG: YiiD C-terminal domain-containing protein [Candidatus Pelagadaptatus aseana]|uniref:PaaI family thioesterase n=1 Tax=Candidatus Pelagadaptatus aseana TaxID=3120508 RepID=UPI0039B1556E